ncbi:MAG TPA: hypothetical protein ENI05_00635 [Porticoccus sp.]|nr:hypothetical protein [Porticoccus sp.]
MRISTDGLYIKKVPGSEVGVNSTTYADGDLVGEKLTLTDMIPPRKGGILQTIVLHDLDAQDASMVLIIWDLDPSSTTFTNNSVLDIADADLPNVIAKVNISNLCYDDFSDNSIGEVDNLSIPMRGNTLFAALVSDGATPTYTANGLSMSIGLLVDEV